MASSNLRRMGLGLFVAMLFSNADAQAQAPASAGPSVIATQVPAGFENLVRPQNMLVDLFYGGRKVGEAMALYEPGRLTFRDPATVARLLPRLKQPAEVVRALSGPLPAHPELVCTQQH